MRSNFEKSLEKVLEHEGGFVDHPEDPGGATNKGITLNTYRKWTHKHKTVENLRSISMGDVRRIYYEGYWMRSGCNNLPSGVDFAVFDYAVNSGVSRSVKCLQEIVGETADGIVGPKTLKAVIVFTKNETAGVLWLINLICSKRMYFLRDLHHWNTFGKGWERRVTGTKKFSVKLAQRDLEAHTTTPSKPASVVTKQKLPKESLLDKVKSLFKR